jgi:hypothetical protein
MRFASLPALDGAVPCSAINAAAGWWFHAMHMVRASIFKKNNA